MRAWGCTNMITWLFTPVASPVASASRPRWSSSCEARKVRMRTNIYLQKPRLHDQTHTPPRPRNLLTMNTLLGPRFTFVSVTSARLAYTWDRAGRYGQPVDSWNNLSVFRALANCLGCISGAYFLCLSIPRGAANLTGAHQTMANAITKY